jgi:hypothetical protein
MSTLASGNHLHQHLSEEEWTKSQPLSERSHVYANPHWGWLLTGLAVVGLGLMAWKTFGPDLRRYLKISRM